jgi:hypothetical protein
VRGYGDNVDRVAKENSAEWRPNGMSKLVMYAPKGRTFQAKGENFISPLGKICSPCLKNKKPV